MALSGYGPFHSDGAYMGLQEILEFADDPLTAIDQSFCTVVDNIEDEHLIVDHCCQAIVAAELVAALAGLPHPDLPEHARAWVEDQPQLDVGHGDRLRGLAARAVELVMRSPNSELRGLLEDGRNTDPKAWFEKWLDVNEDLLVRLGVPKEQAASIKEKALEPSPPPTATVDLGLFAQHPGTVVRIELGDGSHTYGRLLRGFWTAIYDARTTEPMALDAIVGRPVLFTLAVADNALERWSVVDHIPLGDGELPVPDRFRQDPSDLTNITRIDAQDQAHEATFEEVEDLERASIWLAQDVEQRIRDRYAGRPNPKREEQRAKRP
ncbi:MAG: DUF4259 domain-containing protein [Myxococcota bacterium]